MWSPLTTLCNALSCSELAPRPWNCSIFLWTSETPCLAHTKALHSSWCFICNMVGHNQATWSLSIETSKANIDTMDLVYFKHAPMVQYGSRFNMGAGISLKQLVIKECMQDFHPINLDIIGADVVHIIQKPQTYRELRNWNVQRPTLRQSVALIMHFPFHKLNILCCVCIT